MPVRACGFAATAGESSGCGEIAAIRQNGSRGRGSLKKSQPDDITSDIDGRWERDRCSVRIGERKKNRGDDIDS